MLKIATIDGAVLVYSSLLGVIFTQSLLGQVLIPFFKSKEPTRTALKDLQQIRKHTTLKNTKLDGNTTLSM